MCLVHAIDIDLLIIAILHPYVIVRRRNIAPQVPSNLDTKRLSLGGSAVALESQEGLGVTARILLDKFFPRL